MPGKRNGVRGVRPAAASSSHVSRHAPARPETHYWALDWDGCLVGENYKAEVKTNSALTVAEANPSLVTHINAVGGKKVVLAASNRQSHFINRKNRNQGPLMFARLMQFAQNIGADFDPALLADVYAGQPFGTSYGVGLIDEGREERHLLTQVGKSAREYVPHNLSLSHPEYAFDESKILLVYMQLQKIAQAMSKGETCHYHFVDDKFSIYEGLKAFFEAHPMLIPKGISLHIHPYKGGKDEKIEESACIAGTGRKNPDYKEWVKRFYRDALTDCENSASARVREKFRVASQTPCNLNDADLKQGAAEVGHEIGLNLSWKETFWLKKESNEGEMDEYEKVEAWPWEARKVGERGQYEDLERTVFTRFSDRLHRLVEISDESSTSSFELPADQRVTVNAYPIGQSFESNRDEVGGTVGEIWGHVKAELPQSVISGLSADHVILDSAAPVPVASVAAPAAPAPAAASAVVSGDDRGDTASPFAGIFGAGVDLGAAGAAAATTNSKPTLATLATLAGGGTEQSPPEMTQAQREAIEGIYNGHLEANTGSFIPEMALRFALRIGPHTGASENSLETARKTVDEAMGALKTQLDAMPKDSHARKQGERLWNQIRECVREIALEPSLATNQRVEAIQKKLKPAFENAAKAMKNYGGATKCLAALAVAFDALLSVVTLGLYLIGFAVKQPGKFGFYHHVKSDVAKQAHLLEKSVNAVLKAANPPGSAP